MKKCYVLLTVLYLVIAGTALGQLSSQQAKGEVPFDFVVDGTMFPSGTYEVNFYADGRGLKIKNRDNPNYVKIRVLMNEIMLPQGQNHDASAFVFSLDNGQHVLHQVKVQGDNHTHDILHGTDVAELAPNH